MEAFEYGAPPHGGIAFGLDQFAPSLQVQIVLERLYCFPKK